MRRARRGRRTRGSACIKHSATVRTCIPETRPRQTELPLMRQLCLLFQVFDLLIYEIPRCRCPAADAEQMLRSVSPAEAKPTNHFSTFDKPAVKKGKNPNMMSAFRKRKPDPESLTASVFLKPEKRGNRDSRDTGTPGFHGNSGMRPCREASQRLRALR